jgi:hypothetical protein
MFLALREEHCGRLRRGWRRKYFFLRDREEITEFCKIKHMMGFIICCYAAHIIGAIQSRKVRWLTKWNIYWKDKNIYLESLGKGHLDDLVVNGRIILTSMLIGFFWLEIRSSH